MKFVITAGPTREPLDPVRYLSNRSSGKMGYAIAAAARETGHEVILISGPVALTAPAGAEVVPVTTGEEMFATAAAHFARCDVFVMCAAVCDYKPARYAAQKMKKERGAFSLALEPARDILSSLTSSPHDCFVVGFAAETEELRRNAQRKLAEKKCDLLVANDVARTDIGMDSDDNELLIFFKSGAEKKLWREKKTELARTLLKIILDAREKCLTKKT
ncbi:MAG: phosphopantothenoylcysteine decarboxylase [Chthoniobacterales bacterium]|nr:phosphopantothenoylcysteine decarboxylase [Chthoniobacterales bacterium]